VNERVDKRERQADSAEENAYIVDRNEDFVQRRIAMQWMPFILTPASEIKHNSHRQPHNHRRHDPDGNFPKVRTHTAETTEIVKQRKYAVINDDKRREEAEKCSEKLKPIDTRTLEKTWPLRHGFY
jgi:hypothetical protein